MRLKYLLIILSWWPLHITASDLTEANSFLKSGDLDKAIVAYEAMLNQDYVGFELFYNLGTAYEKKGDRFKALLNFERASLLKPADVNTRSRINEINAELIDHPPIFENTGLLSVLNRIQYSLPIDGWAALSIFFMFCIPLSIFIVYKFEHLPRKKLIFSLNILWFTLSAISLIIARNVYHHKYLELHGLVNKESIAVKSNPDPNAAILFNLHECTKVEVSDSSGLMYFIRFAEKSGWINKSDIHTIAL